MHISVTKLMGLLILESKNVLFFETVSEEFASAMEELLPIITEIESLQGGHAEEELKNLKDIIEGARELVHKCSKVWPWEIISKYRYTKQIKKINEKIFNFCQVQLQLILLRNQLKPKVIIKSCECKCKCKCECKCECKCKFMFMLVLLGVAGLIFILIQESQVQACLAWITSTISYVIFIAYVLSKMFLWLVVKACFFALVAIFVAFFLALFFLFLLGMALSNK